MSPEDQVVRPDVTVEIAGRWGGVADIQTVTMGETDDPNSHVIAGTVMSPGQTDAAVIGFLEWLKKKGIE